MPLFSHSSDCEALSALVVDDDPIQLELASMAIEASGIHQVWRASDAKEIVDKIGAGKANFDIVFLDILMPGMDGVTACRLLKRTKLASSPYVVAMTALDRHDDIDRVYAAGADDYIIKPFEQEELIQRLKIVARRKAAKFGGIDADIVRNDVLSDVEGLVEFSTLQTYVDALDRGRSALSMVTCFIVDSVSGNGPFESDLRFCAEQIKQSLSATPHVLAYYGSGIFVCITRLADPAISNRLISEVNARLSDKVTFHMVRSKPPQKDATQNRLSNTLHSVLEKTRKAASLPQSAQDSTLSLPDLFSR